MGRFRIEIALTALILVLADHLADGRSGGAVATRRDRRTAFGRRPGRHHRARDPPAAHAARRADRRDARAVWRRAAGPVAQSARGAGAVRRAAGGSRCGRAGDRVWLCSGDVVRRAGRGHSRRAGLDRGTGRHRGPAREPDRHAARRACARELRRGHDGADPQPRAESVHRAGDRVLAARLAGRPIERSSDHRGAVHAGELDLLGSQGARVPRAHARRGCAPPRSVSMSRARASWW